MSVPTVNSYLGGKGGHRYFSHLKYFKFSCEHFPPPNVLLPTGGSSSGVAGHPPRSGRVGTAHRIRRVRLAAPKGRNNVHRLLRKLSRHHRASTPGKSARSEEHTSELQSLAYLVCRLLLEKKKKNIKTNK